MSLISEALKRARTQGSGAGGAPAGQPPALPPRFPGPPHLPPRSPRPSLALVAALLAGLIVSAGVGALLYYALRPNPDLRADVGGRAPSAPSTSVAPGGAPAQERSPNKPRRTTPSTAEMAPVDSREDPAPTAAVAQAAPAPPVPRSDPAPGPSPAPGRPVPPRVAPNAAPRWQTLRDDLERGNEGYAQQDDPGIRPTPALRDRPAFGPRPAFGVTNASGSAVVSFGLAQPGSVETVGENPMRRPAPQDSGSLPRGRVPAGGRAPAPATSTVVRNPPPVPQPPPAPAPTQVMNGASYAGSLTLPDGGVIRLTGIIWSKNSPLAVINGKALGVGEEVSGFIVAAIQPKRVELHGQGVKFFIDLV